MTRTATWHIPNIAFADAKNSVGLQSNCSSFVLGSCWMESFRYVFPYPFRQVTKIIPCRGTLDDERARILLSFYAMDPLSG